MLSVSPTNSQKAESTSELQRNWTTGHQHKQASPMRPFRCLLLPVALCLVNVASLSAAKEDPVQWTLTPAAGSAQVAPGSKTYFELKATIEPGWHLYSPTTPPGGPIITRIKLTNSPVISSSHVYRPEPVRKLDPNFQLETETYTSSATFLIEAMTMQSGTGTSSVEAIARYQACS